MLDPKNKRAVESHIAECEASIVAAQRSAAAATLRYNEAVGHAKAVEANAKSRMAELRGLLGNAVEIAAADTQVMRVGPAKADAKGTI